MSGFKCPEGFCDGLVVQTGSRATIQNTQTNYLTSMTLETSHTCRQCGAVFKEFRHMHPVKKGTSQMMAGKGEL